MTRLEDRQDLDGPSRRGPEPWCQTGSCLRSWRASIRAPSNRLAEELMVSTIERRSAAGRNPGRPLHALTEAERARIVEVANEPRFAETLPARTALFRCWLTKTSISPANPASTGCAARMARWTRRGRARPPRRSRPPTTQVAVRPGDVWCWDVTFLARDRARTMVLRVPDPRSLQPQDRRLLDMHAESTPTAPVTPRSWPGRTAHRRGAFMPCR